MKEVQMRTESSTEDSKATGQYKQKKNKEQKGSENSEKERERENEGHTHTAAPPDTNNATQSYGESSSGNKHDTTHMRAATAAMQSQWLYWMLADCHQTQPARAGAWKLLTAALDMTEPNSPQGCQTHEKRRSSERREQLVP
jgi:hypothetical protein